MSFDIRQLRYAITAADHGSFYRAARALEVEQSTLSRNISKLERVLGTPIFERSRAGVKLTLAGSTFLHGAKTMVARADKLVAMMRAVGQGRVGGLMLGHNSSVSAGNLRATLMSWREAHPDVEVECVEADRGVLLGGLKLKIAALAGPALQIAGVSTTTGQPSNSQSESGTIVHRRWRDTKIGDLSGGDTIPLQVQRETDQGTPVDEMIPFGLAVTIEMPGAEQIYTQVRNNILLKPQVGIPV